MGTDDQAAGEAALGRIAHEWHALLNAVMFFTRVRVPRSTRWSPRLLEHASAWLPLVGAAVGAVSAVVGWATEGRAGALLASVLATATGVLLTGAFHEDGLADACDGLGSSGTGAYADPERALAVMKDSRIGTYGSVGLVLVLATKVSALARLATTAPHTRWLGGWSVLVLAHVLSRITSITLLSSMHYVRADASSKAKPLATHLGGARLAWVLACGGAALAVLCRSPRTAVLMPVLLLVHLAARRTFMRRLGGYTGDCLGATQQVAEVACYLTLVLLPVR